MVASEEEKERHRKRLRKRNKIHREMMSSDSPFRRPRVVPSKRRDKRKGNKGNMKRFLLEEE